MDKGYAYEVNGDVYFSTRKFDGYGKLSGQNIEDLESGARIAVGDIKQDPLDFALWKARKEDDEIAWESPWGMGRPGLAYRMFCYVKKHLGIPSISMQADRICSSRITENEIAQSECCNGVPFANYWMHNGYITIDNEKDVQIKKVTFSQ